MVEPPLVEPDSRATAVRRAATVERTEEEVVLKYSENLDAEPERAAVEAAVEREAEFERALRRAVAWDPEQFWMVVRLSLRREAGVRDLTDWATSGVMDRDSLLEAKLAAPVSSVLLARA